jgi:hypothetical protein
VDTVLVSLPEYRKILSHWNVDICNRWRLVISWR